MGDKGLGRVEVYHPEKQAWLPGCITNWDNGSMAQYVCKMLGYT